MTIRNAFRTLLAATAASLALFGPARAADEIKIGEINSYSGLPAFTQPYKKGWELALDEINAKGGVDGKTLVVISKDDGGKPADAVTAANELVSDEGVAMLMGTFFSNVGLAVSDFAAQKKVLFLAAEPLTDAITWSKGNRYTFRLRPSNTMQAGMLAEEAAKLPAKRWATIAPNYEYGQSAVAAFKKLLSAKRPDIQWVAEQWPTQGKIDAGAVLEAIDAAKPDAILNVEFGPDLVKLVREGNTRGTFQNRSVVSFLTGEPEYLDPLKSETSDRLDRHRLSLVRHQVAGARRLSQGLSGQVSRYPASGLGRGLYGDEGRRRDPRQGRFDRYGQADRRRGGPDLRRALRACDFPRDRPPIHHGRLRREDGGQGWQGRHGQFRLPERRRLSAFRR